MSGYPYGNPAGGYPGYSNYPLNSGFPAPPPVPVYGGEQSCASLYGTPAPPMPNNNNFSAGPYGGNQMPPNSYNYGGGSNYPQAPSVGGPMPPQQYGDYGNASYSQPMAPMPGGGMYPNIQGQAPAPAYHGGHAMAASHSMQYQPQPFYGQEPVSVLFASLEQYQGTIFPSPSFNPQADCQALQQAMKGAGTNERALIELITQRSNLQRQHIKMQYKAMFGQDLVKQISGELSGHFRETMRSLFDAPADYDAWSLHQALSASKEGTLREILLTRANSEIRAIVEAYRRIYSKDLEKEINSRVRGTDFKRMLISAIQARRDELNPQQIQQVRQMGMESIIDRNLARQDVEALYKAGAGKWGTDEKTFNAIFSQRSYYQLRATFEEYQRKYGQDIAKVIRSEFSGDAKDAYLVLISCIRDRPSFFAERVYKAISGLGTRDSSLIRVIVTRSEIDLVQIKQRYQQMYQRSLAADVGGDTSGDYKRLLLAIVK